jgi:hypothetical protein
MSGNHISTRKLFISGFIAALAGIVALVVYNAVKPAALTSEVVDNLTNLELLDPIYTNARLGFKINPPKSWAIDESGQLGTFVVLVPNSPDENNALTSLTVIVEPAEFLEDYVRETRTRLPEILPGFRLIENQRVSLGSIEGHLVGGTFLFDNLPVRTLRLIVTKDGRGYNITATARELVWQQYAETFKESLLTFRP